MARNKGDNADKPLPKFDQIQPIDPDEFDTALNWAMNAASGKAIVTNPSKTRLNIDLGNGKVEQIGFTDIPINRAMMAITERYGNSDKNYFVSMRMFALFHIMHNPAMNKWMKKGEEMIGLHPAVIEAAATVMLGSDGNFPVNSFLAKVEQVAKTKYKEEK